MADPLLDPRDDALPWWLTRQLAEQDAGGATAGRPGGGTAGRPATGGVENRSHRDWTLLGTLASPLRAIVDPRGMVTPRPGGWSLDWWVRAGERWYLPAREAAVRQRLRDGTPVVETLLGVPEGTLVHRAFAVRASDGGAHVVVEVENRSPAVGLALVVRPWSATGPADVGHVVVDGPQVVVDGRVGLVLPRPPLAAHLVDGVDGRLVDVLVGATDVEAVRSGARTTAGEVRSAEGRAEAAVVVPVPHEATFRALLPLGPAPVGSARPARPSRRGARRRGVTDDARPPALPVLPDPVPTAEQVVAGWKAQTTRGPRIRFPDTRLAAMWEAQRRHLLVVHAGDDLAAVPLRPFDPTEAVVQLEALRVAGFADEAGQVLASWHERQAADGHVGDDPDRGDGDGAAVVAVADHRRAGGDDELVAAQLEAVAAAAHWIDRRRRSRRGRGGAPAGLAPAGAQPAWVGAEGATFRDSWWALRGLRDAAELFATFDQPEAADAAGVAADELATALADAQAAATAASGGPLPVGPGRPVDAGAVAVVDAVLLGVVDPDAPLVGATLAALGTRSTGRGPAAGTTGGPVVGAAGASPRLTARLGRVELARRDPSALGRLRWLLQHATATATWPEVVDPATGAGTAGAGHDGVAAAEALLLARDLLVRSSADGLEVCPVLPPEWHGRRWEAHDLVTPHGTFGFAVRWHADGRPALLWELVPHPGRAGHEPVVLRAPGLDPSWSTTELAGEVLLAPIPRPDPEAFEAVDDHGAGPADPAALLRFPDEAPAAGVTVGLPSPSLRRRGSDDAGGPR